MWEFWKILYEIVGSKSLQYHQNSQKQITLRVKSRHTGGNDGTKNVLCSIKIIFFCVISCIKSQFFPILAEKSPWTPLNASIKLQTSSPNSTSNSESLTKLSLSYQFYFQISLIRDGNKMDGNNIKSVRFIISAVVIIFETFKRTLSPQILKPRVRFFRKRRSFNQTMTNLEHSIKILVSVFHSSFNAFEWWTCLYIK